VAFRFTPAKTSRTIRPAPGRSSSTSPAFTSPRFLA
jgi:hypothetical protein